MADSPATGGPAVPDPALLGIYLNDHLAAGTAAVDLSRRAAAALRGKPAGAALEQVADEMSEDLRTLHEMMRTLDIPVRRYKTYAARAAERVGRLKPNGRLRSRSPLSTIVELESLLAGGYAKTTLWRTLRTIADQDARLDAARLSGLLDRATRQTEALGDLHIAAVHHVFAVG